MTVGEMIDRLRTLPQDIPIYTIDQDQCEYLSIEDFSIITKGENRGGILIEPGFPAGYMEI